MIPLNNKQMNKLGFKYYRRGFAKLTKCGQIGIHSSETGTMMKKISKEDFKEILNLNKNETEKKRM